MDCPIPSNDARPLKIGDRVRITPKFQNPGDDEFERVVIEVPEDSKRVLIEVLIPNMTYNPTEWIEAGMLERI